MIFTNLTRKFYWNAEIFFAEIFFFIFFCAISLIDRSPLIPFLIFDPTVDSDTLSGNFKVLFFFFHHLFGYKHGGKDPSQTEGKQCEKHVLNTEHS